MARPSFDLEMYAEVDPRIDLLNGPREAQRCAPPRSEGPSPPSREPARAVPSPGALLMLLSIGVTMLAIGIFIGRW